MAKTATLKTRAVTKVDVDAAFAFSASSVSDMVTVKIGSGGQLSWRVFEASRDPRQGKAILGLDHSKHRT